MTQHFGFVDSLAGTTSTDKGFLDLPQFSLEISISIAFDNKGFNTLELIYELFPQFPELISNVVRVYFWSIAIPQRPSYQAISPKIPNEILLKQERETYPIAETVLNEIFDAEVMYYDMDESIPIRNESILEMIRKHPELFIRWNVDSTMRTLYRKLIDPITLYD